MVLLCLFAGGIVFAALSAFLKRGRCLWTLLSAACVVLGVLAGLPLGRTLDELLTPVLAVCAVGMAGLLLRRGGGE